MMKLWKGVLAPAVRIFLAYTLLCGVLYTAVITGLAQTVFPREANGSIIVADGKAYGSAYMGQPYADPGHLWGRVMQVDVSTYKDADGTPLLYAGPSNLSPASAAYDALIAERVACLRAADPDAAMTAVPVDLVTGSGSGLDPGISPAAAAYQVPRIAKARNMSEESVRQIIAQCTNGRFLGIIGEPTVQVLKVNLMLDGILS
jgi:K+-transporting ATPase ATPase C chain